MEAQELYRAGVAAIRDRHDLAEGRRLLTEALRLDPANDDGWLWLARTLKDPAKQLRCVQQALKANPDNRRAQTLQARLEARLSGAAPPAADWPASAPARDNAQQVQAYLEQAQARLKAGDPDGALEAWVQVLDLQPDHPTALPQAVRHLSRQKYWEDVKALLQRALEAGTTAPAVFLTAIDLHQRLGETGEADHLRRQLARLPTADEAVVADIVDHFMDDNQVHEAYELLKAAVETRPNSARLLLRLGDLCRDMEQQREAVMYYERAARLGGRTRAGREADARLGGYVPPLTDRERGSLLLAVREALGIGLLLLLMAWQDAGLNAARLGPSRWAGVAAGLLGGYLLVSATSSPQQRWLTRLLGGRAPQPAGDAASVATQLPILPPAARLVVGGIGLALVIAGIYLVFNTAIGLVTAPNPPDFYLPSFDDVFMFN